jgi:hypothetical protein
LKYALTDTARYELTFMYAGPGLNWCIYDSKTKKWHCSGLY